MACMAMYEYHRAAAAFARGAQLDPSNRDLAARQQSAQAHAAYEEACQQALLGAQRRDLVLKLRAVTSLRCLQLLESLFAR